MAGLVTASLSIEYFLKAFQEAIVITLRKPGKTSKQMKQAGAWKLISLLRVVGKIFEEVVQ